MSELEPTPRGEVENTVHSVTAEDLGAIALVLERANARRDGQHLPDTLQSPDALVQVYLRLEKPGAWVFMTAEGDRLAGFALGYPSSEVDSIDTDPGTEYLALLMVEPDYWSHGVASGLLDTLVDQARAQHKERVVLWTDESNTRARQIYEHKGYVLTDLTRGRDGEFEPQVQYLLDL